MLGYLGIELTDGTRFVLGKNTEAALKGFTVPADANTPELEIMIRAGAFRFKSSAIGTLASASNHSAISTSRMNVALRDSELEGFVDEATGATTLVHQSGYIVVTDAGGENRRVLNTPGQTAACKPSIPGSSSTRKIVGLSQVIIRMSHMILFLLPLLLSGCHPWFKSDFSLKDKPETPPVIMTPEGPYKVGTPSWVQLIDVCMKNGGVRNDCIESLPEDEYERFLIWERGNRRHELLEIRKGLHNDDV
ncbi:MAG TPA: hypothetical protein DCM54_00210 [Gammaproteobacteria bacterium]|nr:hypothetical protein [Gammaproteobacteria bacterium]